MVLCSLNCVLDVFFYYFLLGANVNIMEVEIVSKLKHMLDEHNVLAKLFRYARDRYRERDFSHVRLMSIRKREKDGMRYNLPTLSEVAALIVGDIDELMAQRDLVIKTYCKSPQRIYVLHPVYLSLQYPLLFLYGEDGFRPDISPSTN